MRELRPMEDAAAKERQREAGRERGRGKKASGKLPGAKGEAADKATARWQERQNSLGDRNKATAWLCRRGGHLRSIPRLSRDHINP